MSEDLRSETVVLYIDSANRTSGIAENFSITLASTVKRVSYVEIVSAEIPFTLYTVNSNNNTLRFGRNTATDVTVTIPSGNYMVASFQDALKTAMDAGFISIGQSAGFSSTYSKEKFVLTITHATTPFILDSTSPIASFMGITTTNVANQTVTLGGILNLSGPNYLLIKSTALARQKITRPFVNTAQDDILYKVPLTVSPGSIMIEKNLYSNKLKYGNRQNIKVIDFTLVDPSGTVVNLNGQNWSMTVNLQTS